MDRELDLKIKIFAKVDNLVYGIFSKHIKNGPGVFRSQQYPDVVLFFFSYRALFFRSRKYKRIAYPTQLQGWWVAAGYLLLRQPVRKIMPSLQLRIWTLAFSSLLCRRAKWLRRRSCTKYCLLLSGYAQKSILSGVCKVNVIPQNMYINT